jgi:hypothetical protein
LISVEVAVVVPIAHAHKELIAEHVNPLSFNADHVDLAWGEVVKLTCPHIKIISIGARITAHRGATKAPR